MKSLLFFFLLPTLILAQNEQSIQCSKRDRHHNQHLKSNSLSVAQIAQTEKYDVNYYRLDLNMTNTTTTLSGFSDMKATCLVNLDTILYELFSTLSISSVQLNGVVTPFIRNGSAVKIPVNYSAGTSFTVRTSYNGTPPTAQTNPLGGSGMSHASSPSWGNEVV